MFFLVIKLTKHVSVIASIDNKTTIYYSFTMERIIIYHGSEQIIDKPIFNKPSLNDDYGNAFYCSRDINAAKEWANKKCTSGFVNKYQLDLRGLSILDLTKYDVLNWIAILLHYRELDPIFKNTYRKELSYLEKHYFIDVSNYDIVIGYRADDSFFEFPKMFIRSEIRIIRLKQIYELGYIGKQIAVISEKAFKKLKFISASEVNPIYKDKYSYRINEADKRFREIANEERWLNGDRLIDLVKKDD